MRWRFPDPNHVSETERRTAVLLGVDRFWQRFTQAAPQLIATFSRDAEFDIPEFMEQHLSTVDSRLMWEFGPPLRDGEQRLVITVESERQVRPLLDALLARAPQLPGWEYYAYRMPESWQGAIATVEERTEIDVSEWRVQATLGELHFLDLKWFLPPGTQGDQLQYAAFVLSEALLGEEAMVTWIGDISLKEHTGSARIAGTAPVALRALLASLLGDCCADPRRWASPGKGLSSLATALPSRARKAGQGQMTARPAGQLVEPGGSCGLRQPIVGAFLWPSIRPERFHCPKTPMCITGQAIFKGRPAA